MFLIVKFETSTGKLLAVVYEEIDEAIIYPVTAYEVELWNALTANAI